MQWTQYAYYDGTQPYGNAGDLQSAITVNAAGTVLNASYFRYWTPADPNYATSGYQHGLKYYFNTTAYAQLVTALGSTSPLQATDAQVAPYATDYYEYNSKQQVTKVVEAGEGCSSCGGGLGMFTYAYTTSQNAPGYNSWATKTVETLPDGNENIVYSNGYSRSCSVSSRAPPPTRPGVPTINMTARAVCFCRPIPRP